MLTTYYIACEFRIDALPKFKKKLKQQQKSIIISLLLKRQKNR